GYGHETNRTFRQKPAPAPQEKHGQPNRAIMGYRISAAPHDRGCIIRKNRASGQLRYDFRGEGFVRRFRRVGPWPVSSSSSAPAWGNGRWWNEANRGAV